MSDSARLPPEIDLRSLCAPSEVGPALSRWQGFIQTAEAVRSRAPGPVRMIGAGQNEAWFRHLHGQTGEIPALGVCVLDDVTLSGQGSLFRDGRMLSEESQPYRVARDVALSEGLSAERFLRRERQVMLLDPALLVVGPGYTLWGHWLLDILPRLAVARAALGAELFSYCVIPLPEDAPGWASQILRQMFGLPPERVLRYDHRTEVLLCRRALVPSHAHRNYFLHPFIAAFYRSLTAGVAARDGLPRRILVSRRHYTQANPWAAHRLAQIEAFETEAEKQGFVPVFPEMMDLPTQIALFAHAEAVIGSCGSGMHNTLFSPPGTLIGQIGMPTTNQSRIAALCEHRLAYLLPTQQDGDATMQVETSGVSALLEAVSALGRGKGRTTVPPDECVSLAEIVGFSEGHSVTHLLDDAATPRPEPDFLYGAYDQPSLQFFRSNAYMPSASVYGLREVEVDGPWFEIGALLSCRGTQLMSLEIALDPKREAAQEQRRNTRLALQNGQRYVLRVPGQSLLLATNGHLGYGHWLVDFLPKLHVCEQAGIDLATIKILLPTNMPGFGRDFLHLLGFGDAQLVPYDPKAAVLLAEELVIPHMLRWGGRASPLFAPAIASIRQRIVTHNRLPPPVAGPRLFVKRPAPSAHRLIANRDRLEALAVAAGFEVFQPEEHNVLEQIATFGAATHLLGEYGSTLHNSVFSNPGLVVGAVHLPPPETFDALQSGIGERLGQITGYIFAQSRLIGPDEREIVVDEAAFAACLAERF